ncbi:AsmA family protein [Enterovirga sp.]|uniref:AsmA family protein n=1 Tax=Enterovirga sp. TaxID=2026350 RepID=UPI00260987CA|nr:AsmA family protein [Enterovirga sp.]MDB5590463.1 hypothetical protein [Enterovirga sp.]
MSRRSIACLALGGVALVLALLPWTVSSDRVRSAVARQIHNEFGLKLGIDGPATFSLLPIPRLKLQRVTLADETGAFTAEAAQFKGELRLLSLLAARIRFSEVRIADARIRVAIEGADTDSRAGHFRRMRERLARLEGGPSPVDRVVVTGSQLTVTGPGRARVTDWSRLNLVATWSGPDGDVDVAASAVWQGEEVSAWLSGIAARSLIEGGPDNVEIRTASRHGRLNLVGSLTLGDVPVFRGLVAGQTPSVGALARWTGWGLDLQAVDRPATLSGQAVLSADIIEWPQAVLEIGQDRLDGSLALRLDSDRPKLRATLAGGDLDLGWVLPVADPTRAVMPGADYDVRLSASGVRMGALQFGDLAAGVLVSSDRLDVSIARATLAGGSVRGRLSAALDGEGRDIRGQVSVDKVDLESLLSTASTGRGITGTVAGQATFEALGDSQPDLARHLRGRVALVARDGEISGIALNEAARRPEFRRGTPSPVAWRGGRTRFGEAHLQLTLGDGIAEITSGSIQTPATQTRLRGRISLADGHLAIETSTRGTGEDAGSGPQRPALVLDVRGPIEKPVLNARAPDETTGTTHGSP